MALESIIPWVIGGVILLIIVGFVLYAIGIYNRFFSLKNSSEATLGQIRVAMKKRLDMIEQLLGSVKSYARFEKETFEKVTAMRASVGSAGAGDLNEIERGVTVHPREALCRCRELSRPQDQYDGHEPYGSRPGCGGRDCPAAVYLQQYLAAVQHPP